MKRILIADDMHACLLPLLKEAGYEPIYAPAITRDGILEIIDGFEGLIIRSKTRVDKEIIDQAEKLEFVARAGAGMDNLDLEYLESKGIKALNAPEGNRDALGEHALGMLLSVLHNLQVGNAEVRSGKWDREGNRGIELKGKTVGIYGVGNMGGAFAKKLRGFDCEIIGYDKYKDQFEEAFVRPVDLETFMEHTEILSIHIPLNEETRQLFTEDYLKRFGQLKVLINTSRGEILNTDGLIGLLEDGFLYGAALDVLENERLHTHSSEEKAMLERLAANEKVLLTPHVGGWTFESYQRISEVIATKISEEL